MTKIAYTGLHVSLLLLVVLCGSSSATASTSNSNLRRSLFLAEEEELDDNETFEDPEEFSHRSLLSCKRKCLNKKRSFKSRCSMTTSRCRQASNRRYNRCTSKCDDSGSDKNKEGSSATNTGNDICSLQPIRGPCRARIPKFYYNPTSGTCEGFDYGGCQGNANRFDNKQSCTSRCGGVATTQEQADSDNTSDNNAVCSLEPETGRCRAKFTKWYYNEGTGQCETFIWGGCGGNGNKFDTEAACLSGCGNV